jgi:hypothetical protein
MIEAVIRNMKVRPLQSADLALNMSGILSKRTPLGFLGSRITLTTPEGNPANPPFDLQTAVYNQIGVAAADGSMVMSLAAIDAILLPHALFVMRNEALRVGLQQLILRRQNAFLERFKHDPDRISFLRQLYPTSSGDPVGANTPGSKINRLLQLQADYKKRHDDVNTALTGTQTDGMSRTGVVTQQNGHVKNSILYTGNNKVSSSTSVKPLSTHQEQYITSITGGVTQSITTPEVYTRPQDYAKADLSLDANGRYTSTTTDTTYPSGEGTKLDQSSETYLNDFAYPTLDNNIRTNRAQVDLMDEILRSSTFALRVNDLTQIYGNELAMLDAEVAKVQFNYVHTFLTSPLTGLVTAVYKNLGESAQAGEPILRVEDDGVLLLVGNVICRSAININDPVRVVVSNLFENGVSQQLDGGRVVAIRGHDADNDEWEVIIQIDNPPVAGGRLLPLNYAFDRDATQVFFGS